MHQFGNDKDELMPNQSRRNSNFDFLRLFFALLVILSHSSQLIEGNRSKEILTSLFHTISFGDLAVDGFFLLSGYLIVQSWIAQPAAWSYLKKRVLRIYPGFIVASLLCIFVVGPLASNPDEYFAHFWKGGVLKEILLLQQPAVAPVFAGTFQPVLNASMWTIACEFKCYLLVLLLGLLGVFRRRHIWLFITALIFATSILQKLGYAANWHDPLNRFGCFFFTGGCCYLYREKIQFGASALVMITTILLIGMFFPIFAEPVLAIAGGFLLFNFARASIPLLGRCNTVPDVSYGVYLYGWPVQKLLLWYFPHMTASVLFPLSAIASVMLGTLSWFAVERPFMKLKDSSLERKKSYGQSIPISTTSSEMK